MIKSSSSFLVVLLAASRLAMAQHSSLYLNEFMASNVLSHENANGAYEDWIEIYNAGNSPIDLAGYYITDDLEVNQFLRIPFGQASLTTVPAKGYLVFYADGQTGPGASHLGFKLDKNFGQIALIDRNGVTVLDSISYSNQFRDVSFGRSPDGGSQWVYFTEYTLGAANQQGYAGFVPTPVVDQAAGFYNGGMTISVHPIRVGDVIRYTLDGSDPNETSTQYAAPVLIDHTAIFRARAFSAGALPSEIVTRAYFVNANHALPVLTLMSDPDNLFDPNTGIYVNDGDGRAWERFSELEYFKSQTFGFHVPTGLRIQGNTGPKDYRKKSFRAFFRDGYGEESLKYALYPKESVKAFNRLVFRAGYDDSMEDGKNSRATLLRDPLMAELWQRTGGLASHSSFAALYLNSDYYGIYDIKESIEEEFVRNHKGYLDLDLMRTRWDSTELVYGERVKWNELVSFFQDNTFESDESVEAAAQILDLENFTSLQALTHATHYYSWAYGVFMFREKAEAAKWQWTVWDADRAFSDLQWNGFLTQNNPLGIYLDGLITKKLLQNQSYRNKFINRTADLLNTVFLPANVRAIIDSLAAVIASEIPAEVERWNNTVAEWNENVEWLKSFVDQRPAIVRQQMQDYFHLDGQAALTVNIEGGNGKIAINSVTISQFPWSGTYFQTVPIAATAIPAPGYRFVRWSDSSLPADQSIVLNLTGDKTLSAVFTQISSANAELITPSRIPSGQHLPFVVRIRDANWNINPIEQTPMQVGFGSAHADTVIAIKRGAGTGVVQANSATDFSLSVQNANVPRIEKPIAISSVPTVSYSGTLPTGEVVWDNTADRLITAHLTIPVGCHLIIRSGTWILAKKYVNFYVQGQLTIEGTASDPVVITSENWTEPWGGMEFDHAVAALRYCMVLNGGGDLSKGHPTNEDWHTGHQHIFFGKNDSELKFDQCFFLYSPGKGFGAQDSKVTITNSVTSFVWHGGEFHRVLLFCQNSHLMNLPNDDHIYTEDIDTDGFHIDYVNPKYPQFSVIDRCYFVTGKDDAIDHHSSRLSISNCWLEDFVHEGVAASGRDTVKIFNTVSMKNDQGFEAGWTEDGMNGQPYLLIDHCVALENNVGLRIGDSYSLSYRNHMKVTNSVLYNNRDNIWNYLNSTQGPLEGALEISYSMTNDADYDNSPHSITGVPLFDPQYYLLPGSPGANMGMLGTNMGRADSSAVHAGAVVINEIMYNSAPEKDSREWVELYNPQTMNQDLSGWLLRDDNNTHTYVIPSGTSITAGGYWVLCVDTAAFRQSYPEIRNITGNIPFGFGDRDQVRIFTPTSLLVDSVAYDNDPPWPPEADGQGYSLELLDPSSENSLAGNWAKSLQFGGTPGRPNRTTGVETRPNGNLPTRFVLEQNYPNPFNPRTRISYAIPKSGRVQLIAFDLLGRKVLNLVDNRRQPAGRYSIDLDGSHLPSGIYFYQIQHVDENGLEQRQTRKMVLMK